MPMTPEVSAVIPTYGRPALVSRAIRSALAQTVRNIEVIVVVDGPDEQTHAALAAVTDHRLRVIAQPSPGGAPHARNVGAAHARAPWIALLDDDDEWLPDKLAVQLALARRAPVPLPIVSSRLVNRTPRAEFVMPRRLPAAGEPLSEYLTMRRGLFHGDGFIQTSTIMAPTELFRRVPFTVGLRRQHELDWTLRAIGHDGVDLIFAEDPLVIWHQDEDRDRISLEMPWREQLEWVTSIRDRFTPRAYAAITMSVISSMAAPTRSPKVFWRLLREAQRHGRPSRLDYLTFAQIWVIPPQLRRGLRDRVLGRRAGRAAGHPATAAAGTASRGAAEAMVPAVPVSLPAPAE